MTAAIIKEFFKLYPEQNNTEAVFNVEATTQFILDLAAANPLDLDRFCTWQKSLLSSLSQTEETFIDLLQIIKETALAQQDFARAELIDKCLQAGTPPIPLPATSDIPDACADFHIALFHSIDAAAKPRLRQNLVSDCQYIMRYVEESHKQGSEELFVDFANWLLHMIEALGFEKISLIRYLTTIKLHVPESSRHLFDLAIYDLTYPAPVQEQALISVKETAELISNRHATLFGFIDKVSTQEHLPKTIADCIKHLEFLEQAIEAESPELFKEYIRWADSVLTGLNIETISLIRFLGTMRMVAAQHASAKLHAGVPYLDAGLQFLVRNLNKEQKAVPVAPITGLAGQYLTLLLEGNRKGATDFVMAQLHGGMDIKNIYLEIFQRSQYEIGSLWERNKITVAQEHFCTASTQLIMSMLYPHIFSDTSVGKNVVVTCVGTELHELGARMVADFLEMDGWNTYYLGANTPLLAILTSLDQYKADVLAISVTLTPHVKYAREIIEGIRSSGLNTKIVVGGYPFLVDENLWQKIGADGFTKSALELNDELKKLVA